MKDNLTFWTDVYCKENIVRNFKLNCYCTAQLNIQTSPGGATTDFRGGGMFYSSFLRSFFTKYNNKKIY